MLYAASVCEVFLGHIHCVVFEQPVTEMCYISQLIKNDLQKLNICFL